MIKIFLIIGYFAVDLPFKFRPVLNLNGKLFYMYRWYLWTFLRRD